MSSRDYFRGKRIAVIGLGSDGEMVADIKFLIKAGALVSVFDMKSEERIRSHMDLVRSLGLANHLCGSIPAEDLLDMDLIILSREYPRDSSFLNAAHSKHIPIEYPETLFFKLSPPVMLVGVVGACGKSTVVSMLSPMLEAVCDREEQGFFVIDPDSDNGVLSHLKKIKSGDVVLVRMADPLMRELSDMRMSPHVAVFTTMPTLGSYRESPFDILTNQTYNNFIVAGDDIIDATRRFGFHPKAKMLRTKSTLIPADWRIAAKGEHDRDNAALAIQAARLFKVTDDAAREVLEGWKSLKGRLELVKKVKGIEFYNDAASVSPSSTQIALQTLSSGRNVVLVFGGAEAGFDYRELYALLPRYVHTVVLVPGSGTLRERRALREIDTVEIKSASSIEDAAKIALEVAQKGDRVLYSPGFKAGGVDATRTDRGNRFVRAVRGL